MKVSKCNAGASVKAANGGYMKVKKTGYNAGGAVSSKSKTDQADKSKYAKRAAGVKANKGGAISSKAKTDQADKSKYAKRAEGVKANKGAAINKAGKAVSFCKGCNTKETCAKNGRCSKTGKALK